MKNKLLTMAAVVGLTAAMPAFAQIGGGLGGGVAGGLGAGSGIGGVSHSTGAGTSLGTDHGATHGSVGADTRTEARVNSQAPLHASERAIANASSNSAVAGTASAGTSLGNLRTGLTVKDSTGATLGTISRVNRSAGGTLRNVQVRSSTGTHSTVTLDPKTLSVNGDTVTTTRLATSKGRR